MALYVGIDLHSRNGLVMIIDQDRNRVKKARLRNEPELYLRFLKPFQEEIVGIVIESTFNWYWLVDLLMDAGYRVHLANPAAIQKYKGLKHADDTHDATWLAEILILGVLKEGYIYPKEQRPIRDLLRKRSQLVHIRTALLISLKNTLTRNGNGCIRSDKLKSYKEDHVTPLLEWNEDLLLSGIVTKESIDFFGQKIKAIEKTILSRVKLKPEYKSLLTIPGVGKILALTIMLETGEIQRFPQVGNYASYCRKVPTSWTSDGKQKGHGNKKNGNKYLAWAFSEAAELSRRYDQACCAFFDRKRSKKNRMVAHQALANKLARAAFYIMRDTVPFQSEKLFGKKQDRGGEPVKGLVSNPQDLIGNRSGH